MISKQFLYYSNKEEFLIDSGYNNPNQEPNLDTYGEIYGSSIAYIADSKEIWTHGVFYKCDISASEVEALVNSGKFNSETATKLSSTRTFALTGAVTGSTSSDLSSGVSISTTLSNIDASKITSGTIDLERLPKGALERLVIVANQSARFALTSNDVQEGDTVKQTDTGMLYFVVNSTKLNSENGYSIYTSGGATSVPWSGITGKPTFAAVATSGSYNDLTNKPTIPSLSGYATQSWVDSQGYLTSIPAATSSTLGGVKIGNNISVFSGTISLTKDNVIDALGYTPANSVSAGSGDVTGPSNSTNSNFAAFNGTTGKMIKDSGYNSSSFAPSIHSHSVNDITGLGNLATKDKVGESDLNFTIPNGIDVDSTLNTDSTNPVQNKIIAAALNNKANTSSLSNYYTKSEINDKIASAGGGDVVASGNLASDYIVIGAGTKSIKNSGKQLSELALKSEIPSLTGYATENWVTNQNYLTSIPAATTSSYGGIKVNFHTNNAQRIYAVQLYNDGSAYVNVPWENTTYSLPTASHSTLGGVKIGDNITISSGAISLTSDNVTDALGYTPANTNDIPSTLPNPYGLVINGIRYTGESAVSFNTPKILIEATLTSSTVNAGYSYNNTTARTISTLSGFDVNNPDTVIVSTTKLAFTASNIIKMNGLDDLSEIGAYYIYCLSRMANGKIAINGEIYS